MGRLELIQRLQDCHDFLSSMNIKAGSRPKPDYCSRFQKFSAPGVAGMEDNSSLIKVAIIDNGADKFRLRIRDLIERGVSYVKADTDSADRILPWWMVSDPHGTQMASLVAATNPWCRLYIARVGKGRRDILPEDAVQAVNWAIEQNVDIISISWVTKTQFPALKDAIEKAAKHALVFCSTADQGAWSERVFPADYEGTVRVSATDKYGNLMPASDKKGHAVNIPVPGEDVPAFGPSYMGDNVAVGTVSGSSVATALAAGIASLSLLMLLVFNDTTKSALKEKCIYKNDRITALLSMAINPSVTSQPLFPTGSEIKDVPNRWNLNLIKSMIDKSLPQMSG